MIPHPVLSDLNHLWSHFTPLSDVCLAVLARGIWLSTQLREHLWGAAWFWGCSSAPVRTGVLNKCELHLFWCYVLLLGSHSRTFNEIRSILELNHMYVSSKTFWAIACLWLPLLHYEQWDIFRVHMYRDHGVTSPWANYLGYKKFSHTFIHANVTAEFFQLFSSTFFKIKRVPESLWGGLSDDDISKSSQFTMNSAKWFGGKRCLQVTHSNMTLQSAYKHLLLEISMLTLWYIHHWLWIPKLGLHSHEVLLLYSVQLFSCDLNASKYHIQLTQLREEI